jgi:DNA-binding CsgD family transcriptional regulator/tetratricopeptide (TPR) repeat protein
VSHEVVDRVFALSDGNAFFAEELLMAGGLTADGDIIPRLSGSLRDLLLARFELLGADARTVMRVAATAGRQVSHRLLAAVCDLGEQRMLEALRECVAQHMLVVDPLDDTYVFRHALLREAVHQDLLPGERLSLHRAVALALTADPRLSYAEDLTVAAELSYHWYEARAYAEALSAAVQAGDTAMRVHAFREAEQQYRRAIDLWPRVDDAAEVAAAPRVRILVSAADAARWAGHVHRAVDLVRRALAEDGGADPVCRGELHERLGSYLWESGDGSGSQQAYAEAGALLTGQPSSALTARVRAGQATAEIRTGRYSAALRLAREAVDTAREAGAKAEEGRALNIVGVALTMAGRPGEGVEALRSALAIADAAVHLEDLYRAYGNLTLALENAGRVEESLTVALNGIARTRQLGLEHTRGGGVLANNASAALVLLGRWDEAAEIIADVLVDLPVRESLYPRLTLAEICVARGRFDEASRLLGVVQESGASIREPQFVGALRACEAEQAIWERKYDVARRAIAGCFGVIGESENVVVLSRLCALGLRIEADDRSRARPAAVEEIIRRLDGLSRLGDLAFLPDARALQAQCAAERERFAGNDSPSGWDEVAAAWDAVDRPYAAAYARWREAEAAMSSRDAARARQAARAAHRTAIRLGARPLREEVEALARRARLDLADLPVTSGRPAAPVDPFGLTPREREVLALLCDGLSNRRIARALFVTEKTAGTHVSNILAKLGVPSRGEAAAVAHRLGLVAPPNPGRPDDRPPNREGEPPDG